MGVFVEFYYNWHAAIEEGKSIVLDNMMKHKSPQALVEWLKRTDRDQNYLDQDKKYRTDNRPSLVDFNQNILVGDVKSSLDRAKERYALERGEVIDGEVVERDDRQIPERRRDA